MPLTQEAKENIKNTRVLPFIESLPKESVRENIQEAMQYLQEAYAMIEVREKQLLGKDKKFTKYYPDKFKNSAAFNNLEALYLNNNNDFTIAAIQTYIRELLHEQIFPENLKLMKYKAVTPEPYKNNADFKLFQETPKQAIYYMLGAELKVTKPRSQFLANPMPFNLNVKLSSKETIQSLLDENLKEVKLFNSLYQAIEYANAKKHGGDLLNEKELDGYIPSIWMVTERNNNNLALSFVTEEVAVNKDSYGKFYNGNHRPVEVSYTNTTKDRIMPLVGMTLFPGQKFADYRVLNTVSAQDIKTYIETKEQRKTCSVM